MENELFDAIKNKIWDDIQRASKGLDSFVDNKVIDATFASGFPLHKLTVAYARRKKREGYTGGIGVRTGKLRRAATAAKNWETKSDETKITLKKTRFGLTRYSFVVRTKAGGPIDFLATSAADYDRIQAYIERELGPDYVRVGTMEINK